VIYGKVNLPGGMRRNLMARNAKNYEKSIRAFLGEGTEFKGVITFEGTVRVDGILEGDVITNDTLIIGTAARVKANIQAGVVVVMGELEGKIEAKEKCEIRVGSHVKGEIFTPSIYIEEGAVFEGTSHMIENNGEVETKLASEAEPDLENTPS
jgi:cytoskeletal protein CcmA (bactofilin family)